MRPPFPAPPPYGDEPGRVLPPSPGQEVEPPEVPEQPDESRSSRWPVALAVFALFGVAAGVALVLAWVLGGPATCGEGDFSSDRFGYCARVPSGWEVVASTDDGAGLATGDRLQQPGAPGTILVTAVPLSTGQDLERFATFVRGLGRDAGWDVGDMSSTEVAGAEAMTFDLAAGEDGETQSREVVFVRDGFAWRVQLADGATSFDASTRALDDLLASWVFL
jgi:hypothetical protein